jgi:hypothetical protein
MQFTRDPYRRAAAVCCLLALICHLTGLGNMVPEVLALAVLFAAVAYMRRND